jgi:hypothetical protein
MSAMVSNPNELAGWLREARAISAVSVQTVQWKPSRAMRSFLFLDGVALEAAKRAATEFFTDSKNGRRRKTTVDVNLALICGLSGPWTQNDAEDYRVARLPVSYPVEFRKSDSGKIVPDLAGWKNTAGRLLSEHFARSGISTINFVLTSRHHPFSYIELVETAIPGAPASARAFPDAVTTWLEVAVAELGVPSPLLSTMTKGTAAHTSAMLRVEQSAVERMFESGGVGLLFATGTLAQGLNLPAIAVVISGTSVGDSRYRSAVDAPSRSNAIILNGFGRAGRPGFSNQAMVVLISDQPFSARLSGRLGGGEIRLKFPVISEFDAAVEVHSPIERFLDEVTDAITFTGATGAELDLVALLGEYEDGTSEGILRRTFGAYRRRETFTPAVAAEVSLRIMNIKAEFLERPGVPVWTSRAAMKAGVSLLRASAMWNAYKAVGEVTPERASEATVTDWFRILLAVLKKMPPGTLLRYMAPQKDKKVTCREKLERLAARAVRAGPEVPFVQSKEWDATWDELGEIITDFMNGATYAAIAAKFLSMPEAKVENARSGGPIPDVFKLISEVVDNAMALDAGCFVAICELALAAQAVDTSGLEQLQALPLCIRNGVNSVDTLAWFQHGVRQRVCAHALSSHFPVPLGIEDDTARAQWVRKRFRAWLKEDTEDLASEPEILRITRGLVAAEGTDGGRFR